MVYLLLYQIVMNLVQNTSYQKYVGIFLGTILICIIATPIFRLIKMENVWNVQYEKNEYLFDKKEMELWLGAVEDMQEEMILEEYQEKIKIQIENLLIEKEIETECITVEIENENLQLKKIEIQLKNFADLEQNWEGYTDTQKNGIRNSLEERVEEKWNTEQIQLEIAEIYQLPKKNVKIIY